MTGLGRWVWHLNPKPKRAWVARALIIRPYQGGEATALGQVFHRAVRRGAAGHYNLRQRRAWSPAPPKGAAWEAELTYPATTWVATYHIHPVGFMTLTVDTGHLDFAYVLPALHGTGVATALYTALEAHARNAGLHRLETEASHLAERFFLRQGWCLRARQMVMRGGIPLPNARMDKDLISTRHRQ